MAETENQEVSGEMITTDFYVVKIDETRYWDVDFRRKNGINSISRVYLFDKNEHTYCAEMTYSYWLIPLYILVDPPEARDAVDDGDCIDNHEPQYYNHYDVDAWISDQEFKHGEWHQLTGSNFSYIKGDETDYQEKIDDVIEDLCGNCPI